MTKGGGDAGVNSEGAMDGEVGNGVLVVMNEFDLLEDGWCRSGEKCRTTLIHPWCVDSAAMSTGVRTLAGAKAGFWLTIFFSGARFNRGAMPAATRVEVSPD
jgi:hypothetical protein